ncbi:MAG: hypothetical protein HY054_07925 [Proteobacteria bacterium]|nr:hypothetical protein [Pseudomonadota bacterium]
MRRTFLFLALLASLATAHVAAAEPPSAALRLYAAGEFVAAADLADTQPSASSRAFASRALVTACATAQSDTEIRALLARAEASAREALLLDSRSVDARLQLALVYGMQGRLTSLPQAFAGGYAARGRRLIDQALAIEPTNAHAHAMLGAWNLEVVRRGGRVGALIYNARRDVGLSEFERARQLAPGDTLIALHFAVALLALAPATYGARADRLIREVLAATPSDALGRLSQATAQRLQIALAKSPQSAQRAAENSIL